MPVPHTLAPTTRAQGGAVVSVLVALFLIGLLVLAGIYLLHWLDTRYAPEEAIAEHAGRADDPEFIARGEYLARAGDCIGCHITEGGEPYAGGTPFDTPFGTLYSPNITPDPETGIGDWSDADFVRAMHKGVGKDGKRLYPAFPYPSYTKLSVEDTLAIKAYLFSLEPVRSEVPDNQLRFPFNMRFAVKVWNLLYLDEERFQPDPQQSESWNRGAFLVEALGHCGDCHTSRNLLAATTGDKFAGADIEGWRAFNITPSTHGGIGDWSAEELVQYLRSGIAPGRATAQGPMVDVIQYSTRFLTDADLAAMAEYLASIPPVDTSERPRSAWGEPAQDVVALRGAPAEDKPLGARLYVANCASCHDWTGGGVGDGRAGTYPRLFENSDVGSRQTANLVRTIMHGVHRQTNEVEVFMPGFAGMLDNEEVAALSNYVIEQFGNPTAEPVTAETVASLRDEE